MNDEQWMKLMMHSLLLMVNIAGNYGEMKRTTILAMERYGEEWLRIVKSGCDLWLLGTNNGTNRLLYYYWLMAR